MSPVPKKRAATEPAAATDPKKPRAAVPKKAEDSEEYESVQISTELYNKFNKYPKALREVVEESYADQVYEILYGFQTGRPVPQKYTYHVKRGRQTHGEDGTKVLQPEVFSNASFANVFVLEQYLEGAPNKKAAFVKSESRLANPAFAQLQSVQPGQMGWGFDRFGCLSLHMTAIIGDRLKHTHIFVYRKEVEAVKVEDYDDCQIVEDPDATNE